MVTEKLTGPVLLYGQFSEITESHKQLRLIRQQHDSDRHLGANWIKPIAD